MARALLANNAVTTMADATLSAVATTINVVSGVAFPSPTGGQYFYGTLLSSGGAVEIFKCTARASNALTVVRGQEGTTALSTFVSGAKVSLNLTAAVLNELTPLDGTGATGTWPISVLGNAATASSAAALTATLSLANGGTGATTAAGARQTIGVGISDQNIKSADYTFALTDIGSHILHPSADTVARSFTVPTNAAVAFPIGSSITIVNQISAGNVNIYCNDTMRMAGTTGTGFRTLIANGMATLLKITATEWIISGVGLT